MGYHFRDSFSSELTGNSHTPKRLPLAVELVLTRAVIHMTRFPKSHWCTLIRPRESHLAYCASRRRLSSIDQPSHSAFSNTRSLFNSEWSWFGANYCPFPSFPAGLPGPAYALTPSLMTLPLLHGSRVPQRVANAVRRLALHLRGRSLLGFPPNALSGATRLALSAVIALSATR